MESSAGERGIFGKWHCDFSFLFYSLDYFCSVLLEDGIQFSGTNEEQYCFSEEGKICKNHIWPEEKHLKRKFYMYFSCRRYIRLLFTNESSGPTAFLLPIIFSVQIFLEHCLA